MSSRHLDPALVQLAIKRVRGHTGARFAVRYRRLCAETLVEPLVMDGNRCDPFEALKHWAKALMIRQDDVDAANRSSYADAIAEVHEIAATSFPDKAARVQVGDAFHELKSFMTTVTITDAEQQRGSVAVVSALQLRARGGAGPDEVDASSIADLFVDFVLIPHLRHVKAASSSPGTSSTGPWWANGISGAASPSSANSLFAQPKVRRVAYRVDPPELLIEYESRSENKRLGSAATVARRHRTIHLDAKFKANSPIQPFVRRMVDAHGFLGITSAQLTVWLTKLQRLMAKASEHSDGDSLASSTDDAHGQHRRAAGDGSDATSFAPPEKTPPERAVSSRPAAAAPSADDVKKADLGLLYRNREAALKNVDLQDADDFVVKQYKDAMNKDFEKRVLKPGDPGYTYDKRVHVKPTQKNEWDDDD